MGYSHKIIQKRDLTDKEWAQIGTLTDQIVSDCAVMGIQLHSGDDDPIVTPDALMFNSVEEECESYAINKDLRDGGISWCKTCHRDYDVAAGAVSIAVNHVAPDAFDFSEGDGAWNDDNWKASREMFKFITNVDPVQITGK